MATHNSLQMTPPRYPVSGPGIGGRNVHMIRGEFTLSAGLPVNDVVRMFRLHPRFRVTGGYLKTSGIGAGVTLNLGDAGDVDRYFSASASASAGTNVTMAETGRDYLNPKYEDVLLTIGGATTATSGTIVAVLYGVIEEPA